MQGLTGRRLAGAALILAIVAACTPASDQPSAEQALCDSLAAFGDSVQAIADTDPATDSVEDLQAGGRFRAGGLGPGPARRRRGRSRR